METEAPGNERHQSSSQLTTQRPFFKVKGPGSHHIRALPSPRWQCCALMHESLKAKSFLLIHSFCKHSLSTGCGYRRCARFHVTAAQKPVFDLLAKSNFPEVTDETVIQTHDEHSDIWGPPRSRRWDRIRCGRH